MKYEIQKRSAADSDIWYLVAQTDTKEWAKEITDALNTCGNGEFRFIEQ